MDFGMPFLLETESIEDSTFMYTFAINYAIIILK